MSAWISFITEQRRCDMGIAYAMIGMTVGYIIVAYIIVPYLTGQDHE